MVATFAGINKKESCKDGEFTDTTNMTSEHFPVLSPREERAIVHEFIKPMGVLDKESLMWVDNRILYKDGEPVELEGIELTDNAPKTMVKMGAIVVIMPDKVWYNADNGECGYIESAYSLPEDTDITFSLCDSYGNGITYHDSEYYKENEPKEGDYMLTTSNGKSSLKQYSATTRIWQSVTTTYIKASAENIGKAFKEGDGVKLLIEDVSKYWEDVKNIFVNEEDGYLTTNTVIHDIGDNYITFIGLLKMETKVRNVTFSVSRNMPDMAFITECGNRIWGCSKDGHEIYCCKLGDVTNWNCFAGISTDSYAVTIGSDGEFTGAITYSGYPYFFKADSLVKVIVSTTGAHQTKELSCRGVAKGAEKSLVILNEILFYKSATAVCMYNGSVPTSISDNLGETRYTGGVAGAVNDRYFLSVKDEEKKPHLFVYDTKIGVWMHEDNTDAMYFCSHEDDLYYINNKDLKLYSVKGTKLFPGSKMEGAFKWEAISGKVGYETPDQKYISRISIRITLERGCNVDLYLSYNSDGIWEHVLNMAGIGTRSFTIPIIPKRCDHFQYKIKGSGMAKILSVSKTIEQGSDVVQ